MTITTPKEATTPEQMRNAIEALRRDAPIVYNCMKQADIERMPPEDRYTLLAYQSLIALANVQQALVEATRDRPAVWGYQPIATSGPVQPPPSKP